MRKVLNNMKKIDEDELEEIEEELVEEFKEKEEKKPMPVHSAGLKSINEKRELRIGKREKKSK